MNLALMDHVGLNVRDLSTSFAFYERVFGFIVLHRWNTTWMIQKDELKIGLFERPRAMPVCDLDQRIAISHFAFRTDKAGFDEAQSELSRLGIPFDPPVDTGIALAIFFLDPDGHQIEITTFDRQQADSVDVEGRSPVTEQGECCGANRAGR
jgi:catechol 2,3-dioxygenase-like lactoylglutathione lyase family enzyme